MKGEVVQAGRSFCLPVLFSALYCAPFAQPAPEPNSAVNGNWHLTGEWSQHQESPYLTVALEMNQGVIFGQGSLNVRCPESHNTHSSAFFVKGKLNASGGILLAAPGDMDEVVDVKIEGTIPRDRANTWQGRFTVAISETNSQRACGRISGEFTATKNPPLNGIYSGLVNGKGVDSGMTVTLTVVQGKFTWENSPLSNDGIRSVATPLNGAITTSGHSGATSGKVENDRNSFVFGGSIHMDFAMDEGADPIALNGFFIDASESTLWVSLQKLIDGKPEGEYIAGILKRQ